MRIQQGAMRLPRPAQGNCALKLPTALADVTVPFNVELNAHLFAGKSDKPMLRILFPVPVCRDRGQVAQSLHADPEQIGLALLFGNGPIKPVAGAFKFKQPGLQATVFFSEVFVTFHAGASGWIAPCCRQADATRAAGAVG
ncbi:hypothetical protein [Polaromonas sp. YR568]|uniref:hypothetical protein n=1 Tax=Polaromonas sp. YR568 TaxID=1855301 RepID=UPI003137A599